LRAPPEGLIAGFGAQPGWLSQLMWPDAIPD